MYRLRDAAYTDSEKKTLIKLLPQTAQQPHSHQLIAFTEVYNSISCFSGACNTGCSTAKHTYTDKRHQHRHRASTQTHTDNRHQHRHTPTQTDRHTHTNIQSHPPTHPPTYIHTRTAHSRPHPPTTQPMDQPTLASSSLRRPSRVQARVSARWAMLSLVS